MQVGVTKVRVPMDAFKMADEPQARLAAADQLRSDDLPKKDLINFLQDNAAHLLLNEHRLLGNIKNVSKTAKKEQLVDAITNCLSPKGLKPRRRWKRRQSR
ncbi:peptidyl-prolyl cis-trans isomerase FKBP3-like [Stigmatopora argus]